MAPPAARHDRQPRARELLQKLRGRPDSEHETSFNRLAFALIALVFVISADLDPAAIPLLIAFCLVSLAVFVRILFDKSASTVRLLSMMVADIAITAYFMHSNGAYTAAFWPLLLWTIFGNGFRFGNFYLFAAAGTAIVCFTLVVATTPFWQENMALSVGLLIGLVVLPAYVSQLIKKLSKAKAAAEEASRAKSYFLASVSHELRTPLTAIIGLGAHLRDSDLPQDQRNMAATVVTAGRSLLGLINQLLDFARLGANGVTPKAEPFDLLTMLLSVRDLLKVGAEDKGLRIAVHLTARTPLRLAGDESHIRDVLVNLVGNAVKFTERGSITISADVEALPDRPWKLMLTVTDTGIGIEPEAQQHIFDSFRQADDTIIDRFGGTGLGLAISQQIATLMGGEIGVDSAPGEGSRFWFTIEVEDGGPGEQGAAAIPGEYILVSEDANSIATMRMAAAEAGLSLSVRDSLSEARALALEAPQRLPRAVLIDERVFERRSMTADDVRETLGPGIAPVLLRPIVGGIPEEEIERNFVSCVAEQSGAEELARALRIATAAVDQAIADEAVPPGRALRILVADDNVMNQKVFSMILGRAGHEIETADNGEAALDAMRDHALDVVLMDVNMPVLNGIEATKLYRFTALGRKRIPIVGITADASPATAERCLEAGMDACIAKPIEAAPLLKLIGELIDRTAQPVVPAFDPSGVVTPLFPVRAGAAPAINWDKLSELEELGGHDFVSDLLDEYLADCDRLVAALRESIASGDVTAFRNGTHALRSSGANIGAGEISEMCLHLQRIERQEFEAKGAMHLAALEAELKRVHQALAGRHWVRPLALGR